MKLFKSRYLKLNAGEVSRLASVPWDASLVLSVTRRTLVRITSCS